LTDIEMMEIPMKRQSFILPLALSALAAAFNAAAQSKQAVSVEASPLQVAAEVLTRLDTAWDAASGKRFAAEFTEVTDAININGTHYSTRSEVEERMQFIFDTVFKASTHRARKIEMARLIADDVIIVLSSATIAVPSGPLAPEANSRQTLILIKVQNGWQIRHWHNTPVVIR
jgi:uncharacterized protein (TIGR02246 family)